MVHEWALAEAVIKYVKSIAQNYNSNRIRKLTIKLGVLQSVDEEVLRFSINELAKINDLIVEGLVFEREDVKLKCRVCGFEWSFNINELDEEAREAVHFVPEVIHSYVKCPKCGSRDFEIVSGRGVYVKEVIISGSKRANNK